MTAAHKSNNNNLEGSNSLKESGGKRYDTFGPLELGPMVAT